MVDENVKIVFRGMISSLFHEIANIDESILDENIALLCDSDSSNICIPTDVYVFLVSNLGWIYAVLVRGRTNPNLDLTEIFALDFLPRVQLNNYAVLRVQSADVSYKCLNMRTLDMNRIESLNRKFENAFKQIEPYQDIVGEDVSLLTEDDKNRIGYVVCNFAYFLKGLSHDLEMEQYIVRLVNDIQTMFMVERMARDNGDEII